MRRWLAVTALVTTVAALTSVTGTAGATEAPPQAAGPRPVPAVPAPGEPYVAPATTTTGTESSGLAPEVVIGATDDRLLVNHPRNYPTSTIGQLYASIGGTAECTGTIVFTDTVLTAAHCLYNPQTGRKASYVVFRPAVMPTVTGGFFTCETRNPDNIRVPQSYIDNPRPAVDIGVVKFFCHDGTNNHVTMSDYTGGWMGFSALDRTNELVRLTGYPTEVRDQNVENNMYFDNGRILSTASKLLKYDMDATGGQSGSPVYDRISAPPAPVAGWYIIGVHAGGGRLFPDPRVRNWGTRIAGANYETLVNWCLRPVQPG